MRKPPSRGSTANSEVTISPRDSHSTSPGSSAWSWAAAGHMTAAAAVAAAVTARERKRRQNALTAPWQRCTTGAKAKARRTLRPSRGPVVAAAANTTAAGVVRVAARRRGDMGDDPTTHEGAVAGCWLPVVGDPAAPPRPPRRCRTRWMLSKFKRGISGRLMPGDKRGHGVGGDKLQGRNRRTVCTQRRGGKAQISPQSTRFRNLMLLLLPVLFPAPAPGKLRSKLVRVPKYGRYVQPPQTLLCGRGGAFTG